TLGQPSTWIAVLVTSLYLGALLVTIASSSARTRQVVVGLLLLAAAAYAIVAAGRAMFASSGFMTAASAGRYHYVSTIPLDIILCMMLDRLSAPLQSRAIGLHWLILVAWFGLEGLLFSRTKPFIILHNAARKETTQVLDRIRSIIANSPPGQDVR